MREGEVGSDFLFFLVCLGYVIEFVFDKFIDLGQYWIKLKFKTTWIN